MRSGSAIAQLARKRARNKASLVLFGRAVMATMAAVSGWLGFLTGIRLQSSNYDPYAYGTGVGALFAAACAVIAFMLMRQRAHADKMRAQAKDIEIASFVDDRLPHKVVGDAARLRQVLLNLAGNAIKFTERGGVAVIVEPDERANDIRFLVRDTGIGLAPQDQARVFRDFEQADGSSTRKFGGTGLGLAISKRIVERMDGRIAVDSEPGAGATFSFTVPLAPADGAHEFIAPDLSDTEVLIVAAAEIESALLARRLGGWGAETNVVACEKSAVALLAKRHWDALLVDYPLARSMIAHGDLAHLDSTRRIVLIRPTERHELPALKERGFTGYLVKPVRMASLAARLTAEDAFEDMAPEISGPDQTDAAATDGKGKGIGLSILVAEDN